MIVLVRSRLQALPTPPFFFLPLDLLFDVVCFWALMLSTRLGLLRPCFLARFFADALSLGVDFLLVDFGFFLSQIFLSPATVTPPLDVGRAAVRHRVGRWMPAQR